MIPMFEMVELDLCRWLNLEKSNRNMPPNTTILKVAGKVLPFQFLWIHFRT